MIEKVLSKIVNVAADNTENIGKSFVRRVKSDFVRSPKHDCCSFMEPPRTSGGLANDFIKDSVRNQQINNLITKLKAEKFPKFITNFLKTAGDQKTSDGKMRFDFQSLVNVLMLGDSGIKRAAKLIECKKISGDFRFNSVEINNLASLNGKRFDKVEKLLAIKNLDSNFLLKLSKEKIEPKKIDIFLLAKKQSNGKLFFDYDGLASALTPGGVNLEKLLPRLKEKLAKEKNNLTRIVISRPQTAVGDFKLRYEFKGGLFEERVFKSTGKKINYIKGDNRFNKDGEKISTQRVFDFRNKSYTIVKSKLENQRFVVQGETKIIKDNTGKIIRKEILTPSPVPGIYNLKSVDSKGNVKILSSGEKDKNGCITIKKNLESLDGTKTYYEYYDDPVGNRISDYKIVDKKGKVLLKDSHSFEVIDDFTAISSHNDKSYKITRDPNGMDIKNLQTDEIYRLKYAENFVLDRAELKTLLSKTNAEELITLCKENIKLSFLDGDTGSCIFSNRTLNTVNRLSTLEHEIGHVKDIRYFNSKDFRRNRIIASNPQVSKIYKSERNAFLENVSVPQQEYLDYFVNKTSHYSGARGGLNETVAESNLTLNTYQSCDRLGIRTDYLQQYFPRTIAKIAKLFEGQC